MNKRSLSDIRDNLDKWRVVWDENDNCELMRTSGEEDVLKYVRKSWEDLALLLDAVDAFTASYDS